MEIGRGDLENVILKESASRLLGNLITQQSVVLRKSAVNLTPPFLNHPHSSAPFLDHPYMKESIGVAYYMYYMYYECKYHVQFEESCLRKNGASIYISDYPIRYSLGHFSEVTSEHSVVLSPSDQTVLCCAHCVMALQSIVIWRLIAELIQSLC